MIEARILLEELGDIAAQGWIEQFVDTVKTTCSVMLFDQENLCYKLYFKNDYWYQAVEQCSGLEKYFYKEEYAN